LISALRVIARRGSARELSACRAGSRDRAVACVIAVAAASSRWSLPVLPFPVVLLALITPSLAAVVLPAHLGITMIEVARAGVVLSLAEPEPVRLA
jgi:hypothetical protein